MKAGFPIGPFLFAALLGALPLLPSCGHSVGLRRGGATAHYVAKSGTVWLTGRSTIHDWVVEGRMLAGFVEAPPDFPSPPVKAVEKPEQEAAVEINIPVRSLKQVRQDGEPSAGRFDDVMYALLAEETQPIIRFRKTSLTWKAADGTNQVFDAIGELVVRGITNKVQFPVAVSRPIATELRITGSLSVNPSDFGIPLPIMDPFTAPWTVTVSFDWTVERRKERRD